MKAVWNDVTIAQSDATLVIEGNHYFPAESVQREYLRPSMMRSVCPWKGLARYYTVEANGERNVNAAWSYPQPWPWIRKIKGYVAFWNGVEVNAG
ncbi:MAG: DUF427 domain-containing protein [Thermoleophilaceae bacterium]